MGMMDRVIGYLGLSEEKVIEEEEEVVEEKQVEEPTYPRKQKTNNNVVSLHQARNSTKMVLAEPRSYNEVQEIADHLKARKSVIINLHRVRPDQARRMIDFLSGTVYAISGDIQKLGGNIFLCTPENVDIQGAISDWMDPEELDNLR